MMGRPALKLHLHLCAVVGRVETAGPWAGSLRVGAWKLEGWHLYRLVETRAVKDARVRWRTWRRVL